MKRAAVVETTTSEASAATAVRRRDGIGGGCPDPDRAGREMR